MKFRVATFNKKSSPSDFLRQRPLHSHRVFLKPGGKEKAKPTALVQNKLNS